MSFQNEHLENAMFRIVHLRAELDDTNRLSMTTQKDLGDEQAASQLLATEVTELRRVSASWLATRPCDIQNHI